MKDFWVVLDIPFNRANYPDLIGQRFETPPSFAGVKTERQLLQECDNYDLICVWNVCQFSKKVILIDDGRMKRLGEICDELLTERHIEHTVGKRIVQ